MGTTFACPTASQQCNQQSKQWQIRLFVSHSIRQRARSGKREEFTLVILPSVTCGTTSIFPKIILYPPARCCIQLKCETDDNPQAHFNILSSILLTPRVARS